MKNYLKGIEKIEDSDIFNRILYNTVINKNTRIGVINYVGAGLKLNELIDSFIWMDTIEGNTFWYRQYNKYGDYERIKK